jgi:CRP-like cAMP-binding protein
MQKRRKTPLKKIEFEANSCTVDSRLKILHGLPFFKNLSHEAINDINTIFRDYHYSAGETIYFSGDKSTQLCVVAEGSIKLVKHSSEGQDVLIDILKKGEFFGTLETLGNSVYQETAEAKTNSCILKVNSEQFRKILQNYPLSALNVIDIVSDRLKLAYEKMKQLSVQNVEQRIAFTLYSLTNKVGEKKDDGLLIQLPLSRSDLAGMTGTTTETASRIMSHFQKQGIIKTGRQWVSITDYNKLQSLADIDL